jgi:hypothetical protein
LRAVRRLIVLVTLTSVTCLGFGSALVLAGSNDNGTPGTGAITICHSGNGKQFTEISADASGVLSGHAGHPNDIIPPFYYFENGATTQSFYPGLNMNTLFGGFTGAEVLANGCTIPTGGGITSTSVSTTTVTVPTTITATEAGTTVTLTGTTVTQPVTITINLPAITVTTPGTTTVVTVPPGQTTTVTLPEQTVTLPSVTETAPGETVDRQPVTVTQPGTTQTITGGTTTTVVTVTAPNKTVEGGVLGARHTVVTVTTPSHIVHLPGHIVTEVVKAHALAKRIFVTLIRACEGSGPGKG